MDTNYELVRHHADAMRDHLILRCVGLVSHTPSDHPVGIGSGTCVEIGGRHFVATAAHVVKDVKVLTEIGIVSLLLEPNASYQTPRLIGSGFRGGTDDDSVDVGWLEVEPKAVPDLLKIWKRAFVTLDRFSVAPVLIPDNAYVLGTPWDMTKRTALNGRPFFVIGAFPYLTRTRVKNYDGSAAHDLYLEYVSNENPASGRKLPKAPGMSGCGMWLINSRSDALWTPEHARLVAVQRSWREGEYLRGTLIRHWLEMMRDDIPALAKYIDPVLTK
jgi:hypothetical protein